MANSTYINLYGQSTGQISIDGTKVRGEGGPINPQLVFPLEVQLDNQSDEAMLGIGRVRALLGTDQNVQPATAICPPVSENLIGTNPAFRVTSRPRGQVTSSVELRFFLAPSQVEELERRRHASRGDIFNLYLQLEPTIIGLKNFNRRQRGSTPEPRIWDPKYGEYAELAVFWAANQPPALRVDLETSTWVRSVLPGLGHDRVRLVEVTLPPALPDKPNAAAEFDNAKAALDTRRYQDAVVACRGLLRMWTSQLGATKTKPVATVVAERLGWTEDDGRRRLLDALWKATMDFVNAPHHPEGAAATSALDMRDARLTVLLTAVLSEHLGSIAP
jgi:hypothetical protein